MLRTMSIVFMLIMLVGCAGMKIPFKEEPFARSLVETSHAEINSDCISLPSFQVAGRSLENSHLNFLVSYDLEKALNKIQVIEMLGDACQDRLRGLTTEEIRIQLFGNLQVIPNPERLQHLGGIIFEYQDTITLSGLSPTFHLEQLSGGPLRGLVVIYQLKDGKVLHLNYFGTDNVDRRSMKWPLMEFFGFLAAKGAGFLIP